MSKHDADCLRRKVEMGFPYLCTCDLTDAEVDRRHEGQPTETPPNGQESGRDNA